MREEEKIFSGVLFNPGDPELKAIKLRSHKLSAQYSATGEDETEIRAELIRQMLAEFGEGSFLQGPVFFHYGRHTKIGRRCFFNYNLTIQDDAPVVIGDDNNFAGGTPLLARRKRSSEALLLCETSSNRQRLLVRRECRGLSRRHDRRRLRDRGRKRGHPRHPSPFVRSRQPVPRHPGDHRSRQHGPQAGNPRRQPSDAALKPSVRAARR